MRIKRMIALFLAMVTLISIVAIPANAYEDPEYYKGFEIHYGDGLYWGNYCWSTFLGIIKHEEKYYLLTDYYRCWDYYTGGWIANNGQTLSLTTSVTHTSEISATVSSEIGASYEGISGTIEASMTNTASVAYSSSLGLSYNLKDYDVRSVRIAAMGYICEFEVKCYKNQKLQKTIYTYAFDTDWGYEITLVYRY